MRIFKLWILVSLALGTVRAQCAHLYNCNYHDVNNGPIPIIIQSNGSARCMEVCSDGDVHKITWKRADNRDWHVTVPNGTCKNGTTFSSSQNSVCEVKSCSSGDRFCRPKYSAYTIGDGNNLLLQDPEIIVDGGMPPPDALPVTIDMKSLSKDKNDLTIAADGEVHSITWTAGRQPWRVRLDPSPCLNGNEFSSEKQRTCIIVACFPMAACQIPTVSSYTMSVDGSSAQGRITLERSNQIGK